MVDEASFYVMLPTVDGLHPKRYSSSTMEECLLVSLQSQVDDLITCGAGEKYEKSMKDLTNKLHLKKKPGESRFCGKNLVQPEDKSISLEQVSRRTVTLEL